MRKLFQVLWPTVVVYPLLLLWWQGANAAREPAASLSAPVGPQAVWQLPENLVQKFRDCALRLECLAAVMRQGGASPAAIAFTRMIKGEGYLESFQEMGLVGLASVAYPVRANTNQAYFLVNGTPPLISVEELGWQIDISKDPLYPSLLKEFPKIMIWGGGAEFQAMQPLPGGGQRFIFAYYLLNGCHACEVGGSAQVALDFDARARFLGTKLLGLSRTPPH